MTDAVRFRAATPQDLAASAQVFSDSIAAYVTRLNQPWFAGDVAPLVRLLGHFLATDPERFVVATVAADPERVVGFGSATVRGGTWFLGMLFVLPEFQGAGVGRALLERILPTPDARAAGTLALATATDSLQPISTALYSTYGMVPRLPVYYFVGRPERTDHLPRLPNGIRVSEHWADERAESAIAGDLARIDTATLGAAHPQDHDFLRSEGRRRFLYRSAVGDLAGYGYIAPSGRIGPIAAHDARLLAPIGIHLIESVSPPGAYATWITGAADELFMTLLRAGFRFESFPTLLLWNRPFADFARYVPSNLALL